MYFVRVVLFCADWFNDYLYKNCPYIAAAIAFYTLFSLFPLFLAIISILGFMLGPNGEREQLAADIAAVIPVSTEYISETIQSIVRNRAITGIASIFGLLWAASAVFGAIRKGVNNAWGIRKPRPFLKERFIDFALVLGAGIVVLVILFSGPAIEVIRQIAKGVAPESEFLSGFFVDMITRAITPILAFLAFLVLYRYIPNTRVTYKAVWPTALVASLAFDGTNWGFLWYVRSFPVYNVVYGSVGAVLALLTWVYLTAIILLFGALVSSRYAAHLERQKYDEPLFAMLWAGLSRVRIRVMESPAPA